MLLTPDIPRQLPGVSPLVFSRFLLEKTAFLSLSDMGKALPSYEEIPIACEMAGLLIAFLLGEDAAAVFLHVKAQLPRTGLAVAEHGAEILIIKFHAVFLRRAVGHVAHQLVLLIGADEQRRRKRVEPALLRGPCRLKKAHFVAFDAPARDIAGYLAHEWPQAVIVAHEKGQLDGLRVFLQAVPPGAVFGKGMDVGIVPVAGQVDPIRAQRVDRHIRAGRAADVHQ